jgi:esterase/lipase
MDSPVVKTRAMISRYQKQKGGDQIMAKENLAEILEEMAQAVSDMLDNIGDAKDKADEIQSFVVQIQEELDEEVNRLKSKSL